MCRHANPKPLRSYFDMIWGQRFYWKPGIKTSSTSKDSSQNLNNWASIAYLQVRALPLREGPESHFIFCPLLFPPPSSSSSTSSSSSPLPPPPPLCLNQSNVEVVLWDLWIEMEQVWWWGGGGAGGQRWVGLMWPRELPERKMWKRERRGTLMGVSECQHRREREREIGQKWYMCVTVACVCTCRSMPMFLQSPPAPPYILHTLPHPLPLFLFYFSLHSSPTVYADSNLTGPGLTDLKAAG